MNNRKRELSEKERERERERERQTDKQTDLGQGRAHDAGQLLGAAAAEVGGAARGEKSESSVDGV